MKFDSGRELFSRGTEGICPKCSARVPLRPSWRPEKTGLVEKHSGCEVVNYEVPVIRHELPEVLVSALAEKIPSGPNAGLLAARALRRERVVAVQMNRMMRRPPRDS